MLGVANFCVKHANLRVRGRRYGLDKKLCRHESLPFCERLPIGRDTLRRSGPDGYHAQSIQSCV